MAEAIDWMDKNADKSVDDLKADDANAAEDGAPADPVLQVGETARSLVCNDCGKKFRSTAQAEFHASKTEHQDFSESTEEIAPLTEEEKKQKLADLKEKLAEKRALQSEQDKIDKKRNEEINRKKTKESQEIKESMKEAELKRKEKAADIEAKRRIQAKIAADKEERRLKNEREKAQRAGQALPPVAAATPEPTPAATSKPASAYTETRLRLQTANGNVMKTFPVDTTLFEVAAALNEESGMEVESFTQTFPRKVFNNEFFGETLKDLKMVPSASLIVK